MPYIYLQIHRIKRQIASYWNQKIITENEDKILTMLVIVEWFRNSQVTIL